MMTWECRRIARAKATSCFSPALREADGSTLSSSFQLSPNREVPFAFTRWHLVRASQHSWSECSPKGSRLLLIVPENKDTSWLTMVCQQSVRDLRDFSNSHYYACPEVLKSNCTDVDAIQTDMSKCDQETCAIPGVSTYIILPAVGSTMRSKDIAKVDLPSTIKLPQ